MNLSLSGQSTRKFLFDFKEITISSTHTASCPCGFSTSVQVGGMRSSFSTYSTFPYLCEKCGIVDVNVKAEGIACPICESENINQYGTEKVSDLSRKQMHEFSRLQNHHREAFQDWHKCPACKNFTLSFSSASIFYD